MFNQLEEKTCIIVAELGINCNGDVNKAKRLIDMAHFCGCQYVKLQKRNTDLVYTEEELDKPRQSPWGTTTRQQKEGLEFSFEDYSIIDQYCFDKGIKWFASPWDYSSVNFLKNFNIPFIKIPSALIVNQSLLEEIKSTNIPVIISTGMSTKQDVDNCLSYLGYQVEWILACTSTYPTPDNEMNLNFVKTLVNVYGSKYKIGFSNHHPGIIYCFIAYAFGAKMIEVHICEKRSDYGSDQASSLELPGLLKLSRDIHDIDLALGTGEWTVFESEKKIAEKLRRY